MSSTKRHPRRNPSGKSITKSLKKLVVFGGLGFAAYKFGPQLLAKARTATNL